jgi:general stress protein YciG
VAKLTKTEEEPPKAKPTPKDPAAVALGRKGGKSRAKNLTADQLREIGRKGAEARWKKSGD